MNYTQPKPRIILFCPVRVGLRQLDCTLASHQVLDQIAERWYYNDNEDPRSYARLESEGAFPDVCILPPLPELAAPTPEDNRHQPNGSHQWSPQLVTRIASIRNYAIEQFLQDDRNTHLFIVDADIICHPELVRHLASLDQKVVSEVFWSKWEPDQPYQPNVWDYHNYGFHSAESVLRLKQPGQYEVGGLGACTLIKTCVLEAGVNYSPLVGQDQFPGEDRAFCTRATASGVRLMADTCYTPFHVYREDQFDEMLHWALAGYQAKYFAEVWLGGEWAARVQQNAKGPRQIAVCLPGEKFSSTWVSHYTGLITGMMATGLLPQGPWFAYSSNVYITRAVVAHGIIQQVESGQPEPDFVLWVDDDNLLSLQQLNALIADLDAYPELDGVAGWCLIGADCHDTGSRKTSAGNFTPEGYCDPYNWDHMQSATGLLGCEYTGFPVFLVRYSALVKAGGPKAFIPIVDPKYQWGFSGEDTAFCIRAAQAGSKFAVDPRVLVPHLKLRDTAPTQAAALTPVPLVEDNRPIGALGGGQ